MNNRSQQIQLIKDALHAAESSLSLAKNLIYQLERGDENRPFIRNDNRTERGFEHRPFVRNDNRREQRFDRPSNFRDNNISSVPKPVVPNEADRELIGVFNGVDMETGNGKKYSVPHNYIAKSMIVEGDTLKLVRDGQEEKFKQIRRVKRNRFTGPLIKKDGLYTIVVESGSYKVLEEAVKFHAIKENDQVIILVPAEKKASWAAIEGKAPEVKEEKMEEEKAEVKSEKEPEKKRTPRVKKTEITQVETPKIDEAVTSKKAEGATEIIFEKKDETVTNSDNQKTTKTEVVDEEILQ